MLNIPMIYVDVDAMKRGAFAEYRPFFHGGGIPVIVLLDANKQEVFREVGGPVDAAGYVQFLKTKFKF